MDPKDLFFFVWVSIVGVFGIGLILYVSQLKKKDALKQN